MRLVAVGRCLALCLGIVLMMASGGAWASDEVRRGPTPDWVVPIDAAPPTEASADEGLRIELYDQQIQADGDSIATYVRYRSKALSPQALPLLGSVSVSWSPASQDLVVHHVTIFRDGQAIDALDDQSFEVLRREQNLEQATLDGVTTAVLQLSGLRVGDTLDIAYTTTSRDPVTGGHLEQAVDLNLPATIDRMRYRVSWPASLRVRAEAVDDWTPLTIRRVGDQSILEVQKDGLQPLLLPDDVPVRFAASRLIEVTDRRDWSDLAVTLKPLYDGARRLEPGSPLEAEVERIKGLSDDPAVRAVAALRLVQDQVRYVALLMGPGALTPATADETWTRRFGDCKAKTTLLLALLDALGIEADPALVSIQAGDGLDQRLPRMSAFNHVLVRAVVGARVYWLDGTRTGDRRLEDIAVPPFNWALPVTGPEAKLEPLIVPPLSQPNSETRIALDASAGLYTPAKVEGTMVFRGDAAALLGGQIAIISPAQKDQGLRGIWSALFTDPTLTEVASAYDVESNVLTLTMKGTVPLTWRAEGLIPPAASYNLITTTERAAGPFRDAPYALAYPSFTRQLTTLKLPDMGRGFRVSGGLVDRTELGHRVARTVQLDGDTVTIEVTVRSLVKEISAAEADRVRPVAAARTWDPPRVFPPTNYRPSESDTTAFQANAPTTVSGWLDRAFALSQGGDAAGAVAAANEAVVLEPENSSALANRGLYRFWTGDRDAAKADLDKASDIDPSERIAMNGHALLAMSEGDYEEAVVELSRALRQVPGDGFALSNRAKAYLALEQYDRALRDIDALIVAQPTNVGLMVLRAGILDAAGRADEADQALTEAADADPATRSAVRISQAELKLRRGDAQGALDILDAEAVPTSQPDPAGSDDMLITVTNDSRTPQLRLEALLALGRLEEASAIMAGLRDAKPGDVETLNNLCWTAAKAGVLLDQALIDCDAALTIDPASPAILDTKGRLLLQTGDVSGALALYDRALAAAPTLAASLYGRGLALVALGRVEDGEASKAEAVRRNASIADSFAHYTPPGTSPGT